LSDDSLIAGDSSQPIELEENWNQDHSSDTNLLQTNLACTCRRKKRERTRENTERERERIKNS